MRLDAYLAEHWPEISRSQWQKYITGGHVFINGEPALTSKKVLDEDDHVTYDLPEKPTFSDEMLPILFEDDDVVVINKPSGLLTHAKGALLQEFSVAEFMRSYTTDGVDGNRPGIVHRLDRATSGVLIAAKTPESKHFLQKQFQDRKVKKTYLAIVHGEPKLAEAIIKLPIERNPKQPQTFRVGPSGKYAETAYRVVSTSPHGLYSLLELKPVTGRTHQLRVHLTYIGCPIVGDNLYPEKQKVAPSSRLLLHAAELEITLPGNRERVTFRAPLPKDFDDFLRKQGLKK